jgi:two-component system response regulator
MEEKIILLVDDNPDDVTLTLRALKANNIANEVITLGDGAEALDFMFFTGKYENRDKEVVPSVILLDIKMPKVDGLEVLWKLRADERTKLVPVVMLTSSNEEADKINGYKFGCNSYIRKPVDFNKFVDAVRQLGMYWLLLNEAPPAGTKS